MQYVAPNLISQVRRLRRNGAQVVPGLNSLHGTVYCH